MKKTLPRALMYVMKGAEDYESVVLSQFTRINPLTGEPLPPNLDIITSWPLFMSGGAGRLEQYLIDNPDVRLVTISTPGGFNTDGSLVDRVPPHITADIAKRFHVQIVVA